MIESKTVLTALFYVLGIPATFLGILENIGTWKANALFVLSGILLVLRIVFYAVDHYQTAQKRSMDLEKQRNDLEKELNNGNE